MSSASWRPPVIFTGELHEADGTHVGHGQPASHLCGGPRRDPTTYEVRAIGPVDVNLLGFMVSINEFGIGMRRELGTDAPPARQATQLDR